MSRFYRAGLAASTVGYELPAPYDEVNEGYAMMARGLLRNSDRRSLYKAGATGMTLAEVGKVEITKGGIMNTIVEFLVDVGHILLVLGGLWLVAGAIWGKPVYRG